MRAGASGDSPFSQDILTAVAGALHGAARATELQDALQRITAAIAAVRAYALLPEIEPVLVPREPALHPRRRSMPA